MLLFRSKLAAALSCRCYRRLWCLINMLSLPALLIFRRLPGAAAHAGSNQGSLLAERTRTFPASFERRREIDRPFALSAPLFPQLELVHFRSARTRQGRRKKKITIVFPVCVFFFHISMFNGCRCLWSFSSCRCRGFRWCDCSRSAPASIHRSYRHSSFSTSPSLSSCRKRTLATCWSSTPSSARRACTRARLRPWWTAPRPRPSWWCEVSRPSVTLSRVRSDSEVWTSCMLKYATA